MICFTLKYRKINLIKWQFLDVILSLIPSFPFCLLPWLWDKMNPETNSHCTFKKKLSKSWVFFGGDPRFFKEHANSISSYTWSMVGSTTCYQPLKPVHWCEKFKLKAAWFITPYALKMASTLKAGSFFMGKMPGASAYAKVVKWAVCTLAGRGPDVLVVAGIIILNIIIVSESAELVKAIFLT